MPRLALLTAGRTEASPSQTVNWGTRPGRACMRTVCSLLRTRLWPNPASGSAWGPASATHAMAAASARPWPRLLGRCADHLTRLRAEETQGKSLSPRSDP